MPPKKSTPKTNAPKRASAEDNAPIRIRLIKRVTRDGAVAVSFPPGTVFDITPAEIKARGWKTSDYEIVTP